MTQHPPHLPAQTCRVDTYHRLQNLKWIVFVFAAAFVSGVAAALVTVAWIAPIVQEPSGFYIGNYRGAGDGGFLDLAIAQQVEQKTVKIINKKLKTNKLVSENAEVTRAALLSSDGWAVAYYPAYALGMEKDWQAVDGQGLIYSIEKIVFDDFSRLLYIKISGQGFRINSFVDWQEVNEAVNWWTPGKNWQPAEVYRFKNAEEKQIAANHLTLFYRTDANLASGSLLFSNYGDFSGIINKDGFVIPSWLVENQINNLLENKKVVYPGIAWRGFWVNGVEEDNKILPLKGFYVSDLGGKALSGGLKKGDVILKIEGQVVTNYTFVKQVLSAPKQFNLTVWRNGEEVGLTVDK